MLLLVLLQQVLLLLLLLQLWLLLLFAALLLMLLLLVLVLLLLLLLSAALVSCCCCCRRDPSVVDMVSINFQHWLQAYIKAGSLLVARCRSSFHAGRAMSAAPPIRGRTLSDLALTTSRVVLA